MANSRQIVALNVGSQRVSMGVFSKTNKNDLILDRYATRLIVLDPSAEGMRLAKVGEAVADLVQELRVKGGVANYSVSGQSGFIRFVKLPALDDTDVEQLIRFEAQQHVPFPLDEVVWDYHLLPAQGLEREAVLVAIKAEDLDSLNDEITSHGLSTGKVDCTQTSLYNAYVDSYPEEKEPVMLIDIGAKSTDLIYSEQGRFFTRSISAGGIFVTSAIAREFNLSFVDEYYCISTEVSHDFSRLAFSINKQLRNRLKGDLSKKGQLRNGFIKEKYGTSRQMRLRHGMFSPH